MKNLARVICGALVLVALPLALSAQDRSLKIGVLTDLSSVYADYNGQGSLIAAQLAIEDHGGKAGGRKIEMVSADHQNKADVGAGIARRWLDTEGVDVLADMPNSSVALAVNDLVRERNKVMLVSAGGSALLTGERCSPNTVHWTYDTWAQGHSVARAVVQRGGKTWFFITADYAFGHDLEKQAADEVVKGGGKVIGSVRHALGQSDFSSFLLQAQSSGAQVVAFANGGNDLTNSLKQAAEFGLAPKQMLAALIFDANGVVPLGVKAMQGLLTVNPFYWDLNDGTRAWARRFQARHDKRNMPNSMQAGVYASILHYLKAVDKVGGSTDGKAVVAAMKALPTDDPLFGKGRVREDGRKLHPMLLLEVKKPEESKAPWDYFKLVSTIPPEQAFRPLKEGGCPFAGG